MLGLVRIAAIAKREERKQAPDWTETGSKICAAEDSGKGGWFDLGRGSKVGAEGVHLIREKESFLEYVK